MNFLKPPKSDYKDYYDQSKFKLVWNASIALIVLLSIVSFSNLSNENYSSLPNIIAVIVCFLALLILKITKKYRTISILASIGFLCIISVTFFTLKNVIHYTTPMWMIINILFTFFTLGRIWGISILTIHFVVIFFYFGFRLEDNINNLPVFSELDVTNFIIESAIVAFGIGYLLLQFIKTNKFAELEIKKTNSELISRNQIISLQNNEKELMLKEIHHRVKNNLQVITSLLRLQSNEIDDEKQSNAFTEAINRVKSIALIHEKMYQSESLSDFDLENYFISLVNELNDTYSVEQPIQVDVSSSISSIGSKSIVPVSLLFNELISNSIKHAFTSNKKSKIDVKIKPSEKNDYFVMTYSDNGTWQPNGSNSFGLELISVMTEQLEGTYNIEKKADGTFYEFILKRLN